MSIPAFAPLGRLYDPLLQLAERVHRAMTGSAKTVWADENGYVFATTTNGLGSISLHATIGTYDARTSLHVIERNLRLALRERASSWIIDWKAQTPSATANNGSRTMQLATSRVRARKVRAGATAMAFPYRFPLEDSQAQY